MTLCAHCGHPTTGDGLCAFHGADFSVLVQDDWAIGNRIMCNFIHRRITLETSRPRAGRSIETAVESVELDEPVLA